jgi:uroporphyrinogen-III synthase
VVLVVTVKRLPGIVERVGAVVTSSEKSNPEARLTLKLRTEAGDQVLLPLSEHTTRQLQEVISQFNRTRDLLFLEKRAPASATLQ